jgi:hypothetical protein
MSRRQFCTRPVRNKTEHSQHAYSSEGDPGKGIPTRPETLPGSNRYPVREPVEHETLDVGPAKPYYDGGMSHGVPSDVHYGGRPAPTDKDRTREAANHPVDEVPPEHEPLYPVPVYMVEEPGGIHPLKRTSFMRKWVPPAGSPPVVLVDQDNARTRVLLLNEGAATTGGVRMSQGPTTDLLALLPGAMTSYMNLRSQDEIFAQADSGNAVGSYVSIVCEYERASQ